MLSIQQPFPSLFLIAVAVVVAIYARTRWKLRHMRPTAGTGALLLWCGSLWMFTDALEMVSFDLQTALFWDKIQYLAVIPVPALWMFMSRQFTGSTSSLTPRRLMLLGFIPAICVIVLLTNDYHGLFVSSAALEYHDSISELVTNPGPVFVVFNIYAYIVVIAGTYLLTAKLLRSPGFRWQGEVILFGVGLTVIASILDLSGLSPIPYINLMPFALVISIPLFVITIIRMRRADLVPIARTRIIQLIPDAILALDIENRVIDMNPAAEAIIGHSLKNLLGEVIDLKWPEWHNQIWSLTQKDGDERALHLGTADQQRVFDVRKSEIRDWRGQLAGRLFVLRDVTERMRAEAALHLSEEHFRALTEHATDIVIIVNSEAMISYASPSIERRFGFDRGKIIGKNSADFVHPEDLGLVMAALAASAQNSGVTAPIVARFLRAEGGWRYLECIANNLLDHPAVRGIVINARDVTERVEVQDKLRLSEEYFRAMIENSTDVTIITDMGGNIQYVSPSLERIFKRSRDKILGHNTTEFMHPDDFNSLLTAMVEGMLQGETSGAFSGRFHDGEGKWHILEGTATNLLDHPAIKGIVVNARDVTEREAVTEALRQSEERYRLHFEHVNDVIYSFDSQFNISAMSPSFERHLGIRPEEVIGKSIAELGVLPPEYFEKAVAETMKVMSGERVEGSIYELIANNGTRKTAEVSGSPVYRNGQVIGTINVARDITERMHAEERLRVSLAEKETLLKEVHHRVKNNMQIIASLLSLQSGTINDPAMRAQFEDSQNRIRSMALVHERLYRSQDLASIDFREYVRDLTGHLMQGYRSQCKKVEVVIDVEHIQLDIDTAIPCGLIINELVSNTLKHAFPNDTGGTIRIEVQRDDASSYCLTVEDNGIGMPPHVDVVHSHTLGLQLVTSLARQLNGTISLHTESGTAVAIHFSPVGDHNRAAKAD